GVSFTTAARTDGSAPLLEFSYPREGSIVSPAGMAPITLRFSRPVLLADQDAIRLFPSGSAIGFNVAEDGRTLSADLSLPFDADMLITIGAGVTDFAGV